MQTIPELLDECVARYPEKEFLVDWRRGVRLTFEQFAQRTTALAGALARAGIRHGDRVAYLCRNRAEVAELWMACCRMGAVVVPLNYKLSASEIAWVFDDAKARALVVEDSEWARVSDELSQRVDADRIVFIDGNSGASYEALLAAEQGKPSLPTNVDADDIAFQLYTSGTTGTPKGCPITHRAFVFNAENMRDEGFRQRPDDCHVVCSPMFFIAGSRPFVEMLLVGGKLVILDDFEPLSYLECVESERASFLFLVPTMVSAILATGRVDQFDLSCVRLLSYAAAPMPVALLDRALSAFGDIAFCQFYGATETMIATFLGPEDHVDRSAPRLASCGRALSTVDVRVLDDDDIELPPGEIGDISIKSDGVIGGYWNLPEETAAAFTDGGSFRTGDLGYFDEAGYLYIVDRKKDMIVSGGENVYPRQIEEVLYRHPGILEAAVYGVPDDYWGEAIRATVVLRPGHTLSEHDVADWVEEHLSRYRRPRHVDFLPELPKGNTGKIDKRQLRDPYWAGRKRRV